MKNQNTMNIDLENNTENNLEFNDQFAQAYDTLENSWHNILIVGKAGTGKSTILQYFRSNTLKNVVVLAPTGVAAVNIKGQTIHSFFRFKPDITPDTVVNIRMRKDAKELYRKIDMIIIDEVSMVMAERGRFSKATTRARTSLIQRYLEDYSIEALTRTMMRTLSFLMIA